MRWGTAISKIATPVAGWYGADCYDPVTGDLRVGSPCYQARARLDAAQNPVEVAAAIYDRFRSMFSRKENSMADQTEEKPKFVVIVEVEADDLREAVTVEAVSKGKVIAANPAPRIMTGPGGPIAPGGQTIVRAM